MFELAVEAISAALGLWKSKESRKYADRIIKIKKEYNNEMDKNESDMDFGYTDSLERELCDLWKTISTAIKK